MHFPVHLPCYDLPPLCSLKVLFKKCKELGESDGRCVRASGPVSEGHSISFLLLNPPSDTFFSLSFVFSSVENVAHFFPFRTLHLDLTFWAVPILFINSPSQDKLTTVVYRRVEQEKVRFNGGYRF